MKKNDLGFHSVGLLFIQETIPEKRSENKYGWIKKHYGF